MHASTTASCQFSITLADGYSFKNLVAIIQNETTEATMVLSPETISISFINSTKCAGHDIKIYAKELREYVYHFYNEDGELLEFFPISFLTEELFKATKSIGKKDSIKIFWREGDMDLSIIPLKSGSKDFTRNDVIFASIINKEHSSFEAASPFVRTEPNVRLYARDFSDQCTLASTLKCKRVEVIGEEAAVTFVGIRNNNTEAFTNTFGDSNREPRRELRTAKGRRVVIDGDGAKFVFNVPVATIKALSKIHNVSPQGTMLKFYFEAGHPLKLVTPVGIYGMYSVLIRDTPDK
jgi:hypothetical protein